MRSKAKMYKIWLDDSKAEADQQFHHTRGILLLQDKMAGLTPSDDGNPPRSSPHFSVLFRSPAPLCISGEETGIAQWILVVFLSLESHNVSQLLLLN
jgi:hypothetical protein